MHLSCCIPDFMIQRHRNQLVRELWRLRACSGQESETCSGPGRTQVPRPESATSLQMKSALNTMLKRLDTCELEALLHSIKSRGISNNQCIHLPRKSNGHHAYECDRSTFVPSLTSIEFNDMSYEFLACRTWRWPDLSSMDMLKTVPMCQATNECKLNNESTEQCINPYHWCKVVQTATDLKMNDSLSLGNGDIFKRELSESTETETSGTEMVNDFWCRIAYRELNEHIGQLFPVIPNSIDIFQDIPQGSGISLGALHKTHIAKSEKISSVRSKIGAGITLSNELDKVWLYNRSSSAIFVSSYSLNLTTEHGSSWRVYKVNPGHAIVVYDYELMEHWTPDPAIDDGPTDPHSIHISFVKGWGRDYRRQNILSCACWLEVLLNVNR